MQYCGIFYIENLTGVKAVLYNVRYKLTGWTHATDRFIG